MANLKYFLTHTFTFLHNLLYALFTQITHCLTLDHFPDLLFLLTAARKKIKHTLGPLPLAITLYLYVANFLSHTMLITSKSSHTHSLSSSCRLFSLSSQFHPTVRQEETCLQPSNPSISCQPPLT